MARRFNALIVEMEERGYSLNSWQSSPVALRTGFPAHDDVVATNGVTIIAVFKRTSPQSERAYEMD